MEKLDCFRNRKRIGFIAFNWDGPTAAEAEWKIRGLRVELDDEAIRNWLVRAIMENSEYILLGGKEYNSRLDDDIEGVMLALGRAESQFKGFTTADPTWENDTRNENP